MAASSRAISANKREDEYWVQTAVAQLREAFERVGLCTEDLEGDRFLRIRHIQRMLDQGRLDADLRWVGGASWGRP